MGNNNFLDFFLIENPRGKNYMARTLVKKRYNKDEFIKRMLRENDELKEGEVRRVLKQALKTTEGIVREGDSLSIKGILKVWPVIRGSFESFDEQFNKSRHSISLAASISSAINRRLNKELPLTGIRRVRKPLTAPHIEWLSNSRGEENIIRLSAANTLSGSDLVKAKSPLAGLKVRAGENRELIGVDSLELIEHRAKKVTFMIGREYSPPGWLKEGLEIIINLIYEGSPGATTEDFVVTWGE